MSWLSKGIKKLGKTAKAAGVPTTWKKVGQAAKGLGKIALATQFAPIAGAFAASRIGGAVRGASHLRDSLMQSTTGKTAREVARVVRTKGPAGYGAPTWAPRVRGRSRSNYSNWQF